MRAHQGWCIGQRNAVQESDHTEVDGWNADPVDGLVQRILMTYAIGIEPILHASCRHGSEVTLLKDIAMVFGMACDDEAQLFYRDHIRSRGTASYQHGWGKAVEQGDGAGPG